MADEWNKENLFDLADFAGIDMDTCYDTFEQNIFSYEGNVCYGALEQFF